MIWLVERTGVYTNTAAATISVGVYVVDAAPLPGTVLDPRDQVDFTNYATVFGDEANPFTAEGGQHVVFQWTGLNPGDRCIGRIQYRVTFPSSTAVTPMLDLESLVAILGVEVE